MTAYAGHYVDYSAVERRLSVALVKRIYDDQNSGIVDRSEAGPLAQLIKDAEAMFEGYCRGIYDLAALRLAKPNEAVRLVLDCIDFLAIKRFPRCSNRDWTVMELSVRGELKNLRNGITRFDVVGAPEPAANQGGYTSNGDATAPAAPADYTFSNNWGSF